MTFRNLIIAVVTGLFLATTSAGVIAAEGKHKCEKGQHWSAKEKACVAKSNKGKAKGKEEGKAEEKAEDKGEDQGNK